MMKSGKKKLLEGRGYKVGDASDFLGLTAEESAYIDIKIACGMRLRQKRAQSDLSQSKLARLIGTSQSRLARMEKGDPSVSLDLLVRALLSLGDSTSRIARIVGGQSPQ